MHTCCVTTCSLLLITTSLETTSDSNTDQQSKTNKSLSMRMPLNDVVNEYVYVTASQPSVQDAPRGGAVEAQPLLASDNEHLKIV